MKKEKGNSPESPSLYHGNKYTTKLRKKLTISLLYGRKPEELPRFFRIGNRYFLRTTPYDIRCNSIPVIVKLTKATLRERYNIMDFEKEIPLLDYDPPCKDKNAVDGTQRKEEAHTRIKESGKNPIISSSLTGKNPTNSIAAERRD